MPFLIFQGLTVKSSDHINLSICLIITDLGLSTLTMLVNFTITVNLPGVVERVYALESQYSLTIAQGKDESLLYFLLGEDRRSPEMKELQNSYTLVRVCVCM